MDDYLWTLRPASAHDRDFLFDLHRATMKEYVDATWGWNDDEQLPSSTTISTRSDARSYKPRTKTSVS